MARALNLPVNEMAEKYLAGKTSVQLAAEYGCTHNTILKNLKSRGIKIRRGGARKGYKRPHVQEKVRKWLLDYIRLGSYQAVADKYGVSKQRVQAFLVQHGARRNGESWTSFILINDLMGAWECEICKHTWYCGNDLKTSGVNYCPGCGCKIREDGKEAISR